jgi:outer membrane protein assembly factor BamE (lipoprotein component of BamABCDE complex)
MVSGFGDALSGKNRRIVVAAALSSILALAGCQPSSVLTHGAIISQDQVDLVPVGSSRDQVLLALGTPSTTGNFGNEVYYYISQKAERKFAYAKSKVVDQRVLAIYFDETATVARVADYGLKDGKVFDFITRTTPTGGRDLTFLGQLLAGPGKGGVAPPINPLPPSGNKL